MSFDGLIPALKTGKIDMIASAMSATEETEERVWILVMCITQLRIFTLRKKIRGFKFKEVRR